MSRNEKELPPGLDYLLKAVVKTRGKIAQLGEEDAGYRRSALPLVQQLGGSCEVDGIQARIEETGVTPLGTPRLVLVVEQIGGEKDV